MKKKICGIYAITNTINGKKYIGQSYDIDTRWKKHKSCVKSETNKNQLYSDIRKFGIDNFKFEILEECKQNELDEKEKFYIKKFDTVKTGYNKEIGGGGGVQKSYYADTSECRLTNMNLIDDLDDYLNLSDDLPIEDVKYRLNFWLENY